MVATRNVFFAFSLMAVTNDAFIVPKHVKFPYVKSYRQILLGSSNQGG
jgi:hypothetical protein